MHPPSPTLPLLPALRPAHPPAQSAFPSENDSYADRQLPYFWTPSAEAVVSLLAACGCEERAGGWRERVPALLLLPPLPRMPAAGLPRQPPPTHPNSRLQNGRVAMVGLVGLLVTELVRGAPLF